MHTHTDIQTHTLSLLNVAAENAYKDFWKETRASVCRRVTVYKWGLQLLLRPVPSGLGRRGELNVSVATSFVKHKFLFKIIRAMGCNVVTVSLSLYY